MTDKDGTRPGPGTRVTEKDRTGPGPGTRVTDKDRTRPGPGTSIVQLFHINVTIIGSLMDMYHHFCQNHSFSYGLGLGQGWRAPEGFAISLLPHPVSLGEIVLSQDSLDPSRLLPNHRVHARLANFVHLRNHRVTRLKK